MKADYGTHLQVSLSVLWDGDATISLITFSKARDMRLIGGTVKISVIKVDEEKQEMSSHLYKLPILDKEEKEAYFQVYGTEVNQKNVDILQ